MSNFVFRCSIVALLMTFFSGCVWVDLNDKGKNVQVLTPSEAGRCTKIGHVTSNTTADVAGIPRDDESLNNELTRLARNYAGDMGGNAVVAVGKIQGGVQTFNVYKCPSAGRR